MLQRFSHRSEGSEPHVTLPSPGLLPREDEPPRASDFEGQCGLIPGTPQDGGEMETSLLKARTRSHRHWDPGQN